MFRLCLTMLIGIATIVSPFSVSAQPDARQTSPLTNNGVQCHARKETEVSIIGRPQGWGDVVGSIVAAIAKPSDKSGAYSPYFSSMNKMFRADGIDGFSSVILTSNG